MVILNGNALQAIVATTPTPTLYWDDNNGHKSSINIATQANFPITATVYADDIALTINNTGDVYAYITCRVLLSSNITEIHLCAFRWVPTSYAFQFLPYILTLQDTRPTTADVFDAVKIDCTKPNYNLTPPNPALNANIAFTWSKSGSIYASKGIVNFANGTLTNLQTNQFITIGVKPDVGMMYYSSTSDCYISSINSNVVNVNSFNTGAQIQMYASSNTIRTVSVSHAYGVMVAINVLDNVNKKSNIIFVHNCSTFCNFFGMIPQNLNNELEQNCTNNLNYKYTGFPQIKLIQEDVHGYFIFEVVWQQVFCNGSDVCTIQAITKRINWHASNPPIPISTPFIYLNSDLSKNSFSSSLSYGYSINSFPSVVRMGYSFNLMDKNTSLNGLVGYKVKTTPYSLFTTDDGTLKTSQSKNNSIDGAVNQIGNVNIEDVSTNKPEVIFYPNPTTKAIFLQSNIPILKVAICSVNGVVLKAKSFSYTKLGAAIDVSDLINGQYFLKIYTSEGKILNKKFIKN